MTFEKKKTDIAYLTLYFSGSNKERI